MQFSKMPILVPNSFKLSPVCQLLMPFITAQPVGLFGEMQITKGDAREKEKKEAKSRDNSKKLQRIFHKHLEPLYMQLKNKPSHGSDVIREAAETLLLFTMNHYNNFPPPSTGPEQINTDFSEEDSDSRALFFIFNDMSILSLVDTATDDKGNISRCIIRDRYDRYT